MRRRLTYAVVAIWICAAVFCVLHLSTTVGERWIWQLHDFQSSPQTLPANFSGFDENKQQAGSDGTATKPVELDSSEISPESGGNVDREYQIERPVEIKALPGYIALHEGELLFGAGLCLLLINWNAQTGQYFRSGVPRVLSQWSPTIIGLAILGPLLWIPCTDTRVLYYSGRTIASSRYRWLWQVGTGKVQVTTIFLEELIIGLFLYFASTQLRRLKAS